MGNNVNLTKALAEIRNYPGARTDRKVFKVIADHANDEGGVELVPDICGRFHKIAEAHKVMSSLLRLEQHGFIADSRIIYDSISGHYQGTTTINPAYMLNTTKEDDGIAAELRAAFDRLATSGNRAIRSYAKLTAAMCDIYAKEYDEAAKYIDKIEKAISSSN